MHFKGINRLSVALIFLIIATLLFAANSYGADYKIIPASHLLDLFFEPGKTISGTVRVSKAPFTYLNRLQLKKKLIESIPAKMSRERNL